MTGETREMWEGATPTKVHLVGKELSRGSSFLFVVFLLQDGIAATGLKRQSAREQVAVTANALEEQRKSDILKEEIRVAGNLAKAAKIYLTPTEINVTALGFDEKHINSEREHKVSEEQAKQCIKDAKISVTVWNGKYERYYGYDGAVYVNVEGNYIRTAYAKDEFMRDVKAIVEVLKNAGY